VTPVTAQQHLSNIINVTPRLRRVGSLELLEHANGLVEYLYYISDLSHNDSFDTDSDTSDDDVMYFKRKRLEPSVDAYRNQKHANTSDLPSCEALVRTS
jgi:hypothetical protein